jgi:hypothetical protein
VSLWISRGSRRNGEGSIVEEGAGAQRGAICSVYVLLVTCARK